jgi:hypothetical protein
MTNQPSKLDLAQEGVDNSENDQTVKKHKKEMDLYSADGETKWNYR